MDYDAIIVGSGPNGLAAACELARAGCSVCLFEEKDVIGGGVRSAELTLPGFVHDICSAVHPLGIGSPYFRTLPLQDFGLEWIQPELPLSHPFDDGTAVILDQSLDATARALGTDENAYRKTFGLFVREWESLLPEILAPIHVPKRLSLVTSFARQAIRSADGFNRSVFQGRQARALFAGIAAHSLLPLNRRPTAAFGLLLGLMGHAVGWPLPRGGSQQIALALAGYFRSLGGVIRTGVPVRSLSELPSSRVVLCDVTPRQLLALAGKALPQSYQRKLERYRYGVGVFKMDWALTDAIPWRNRQCRRSGALHLGGSWEEISAAELEVARGGHPAKPFVIFSQPSVFDASRAPTGRHTAWAYCHVPNGSTKDMTSEIESQVEAAAPGFRDCILRRHAMNTRQVESHNSNYIGGDINGGVQDLLQVLARPVFSTSPYRTPLKGLYICSSSTPPGGGVHGMCGFHAARAALEDLGMPTI